MFRYIASTALIAASLLGTAAQAAEPGQVLVNRGTEQAQPYGRSDNVVGGARRNADGSVTYMHQTGRGPVDPIDQASNNLHQAW